MSKKLVAKIPLPNKKQNSKRGRRRGKRNGASGSNSLMGGGLSAATSMTRITERFMPVFPSTIVKTLRYSTSFGIGAAVGAPSTYIIRANDLFDPDFTGTGHQPMGFDQLMTWYNHFVVLKAKIVCTFRNQQATCGVAAGIRVDGSSTALTVIDRIVEDGAITYDTLDPKGVYGSIKTMACTADIGKLQAVSRSAMTSDPNLRGDAGTSPVEITYFHVLCWDASAAATSSVFCDVVVDYVAQFMEPRDQIES